MKKAMLAASLLAAALSTSAYADTVFIPTGTQTVPVPQAPPADPKDTPEQIARDAARDLTPTRFYNRPGATRAQYDAAWQECRLIARGSRTPSGSIPYYYNPAVISPLAAGIGGGIGGAIGAAIVEGQQRRANRQNCMLIRGWRLVEPNAADAAPALAMTDSARIEFLDRQIGAAQVRGAITESKSFTAPTDAALKLDAPLPGPGSVWLGAKADAAVPFVLQPGEAAIVVAFRRPDAASAGHSAVLNLVRYDMDKRDLIYRPREWKKNGDKTTYTVVVHSGDKKAPYEVQVLAVTPGDYVVDSWAAGAVLPVSGNCFGAPTFHVLPGQVAYLGDFIPFWNVKLTTGDRFSDLVFAGQTGDARTTLALRQPALAQAMTPVTWKNHATYACSAVSMVRIDMPGVENVLDPVASDPVAPAPMAPAPTAKVTVSAGG